MYGRNDDIPAFRWWSKTDKVLFVSNHAADAEALEERLASKRPRPACQRRCEHRQPDLRRRRAQLPDDVHDARPEPRASATAAPTSRFFLSPYGFVHAIVLGLAEMAKEMFQARRARLAGIEPRLDSPLPVPVPPRADQCRPAAAEHEPRDRGDAARHVRHLRHVHRLRRDRPSQRSAARGGARRARWRRPRAGQPRTRDSEDAPRPYRFVVLSDHGQTLGATFLQRFGHRLEDVIRQLMGGAESIDTAIAEVEEWRVVNTFASELTRARGAAAHRPPRAGYADQAARRRRRRLPKPQTRIRTARSSSSARPATSRSSSSRRSKAAPISRR